MFSARFGIVIATATLFVVAFFSSNLRSPRRLFDQISEHHDAIGPLRKAGKITPLKSVPNILYDSGLIKREDVCNETFPGRYSQTCDPSNTLCCIIPGASRPACVTILGYGFCCTEHTDCFVDTDSACGDTGAATCAKNKCCPQYTNCVESGYNYTANSMVRCNVDRSLIPGYSSTASASPTSKTGTKSPASRTASQTATTTTATSAPSSTDTTNLTTSTPGGAIAGIVVGSLAGLALIGLAGWFLYRRSRKNKTSPPNNAAYEPYHSRQPPQELDSGVTQEMDGQQYYDPPKDRYAHAHQPRSELPADVRRQELP